MLRDREQLHLAKATKVLKEDKSVVPNQQGLQLVNSNHKVVLVVKFK